MLQLLPYSHYAIFSLRGLILWVISHCLACHDAHSRRQHCYACLASRSTGTHANSWLRICSCCAATIIIRPISRAGLVIWHTGPMLMRLLVLPYRLAHCLVRTVQKCPSLLFSFKSSPDYQKMWRVSLPPVVVPCYM